MPSVTIIRPGVKVEPNEHDSWSGWRFNAEVDGQVGTISTYSPTPESESQAAAWAQRELEMHPEKLEGII
jgi:hypothetical protein